MGDDDAVEHAAEHAAEHAVVCHLSEVLDARGMTLAELSRIAGVSVVNLSVLKNNRARAIRFSTLTVLCAALGCTPGDLFSVMTSTDAPPPS